MFVRPCWKPASEHEVYSFIDEYPWALIVTNGANGPFATNLPLLLDRWRGEKPVLVGHIARANEHAHALIESRTPSLAIFQGPYSYVTASWYPQRDMPSTYYYTAVHCYGTVVEQSEAELRRWIEILTERSESAFLNGWKMNEIEEPAITRRLKAITGFELQIERIEAKFKLGQDEPKKDALAVAEELRKQSDADHKVLAELISKYNIAREE